MSGSGSMTPIVPGAPTSAESFKPPVRTIVPLQNFAEIMEVEPIQFMGGDTSQIMYQDGSRDMWQLYAWQDPKKLSRSELARQLRQAESDIANIMGYFVGPKFETDDERQYPTYYNPRYHSANGRRFDYQMKTIGLTYIKLIQAGVKKLEFLYNAVKNAQLVYSGLAASSWSGTCTLTVQVPIAYSDPGSFRVFYADSNGHEDYEIRPFRAVTVTALDASTNEVTITLDAWLLFKRTLQGAYDNYDVRPAGINIHDIDSYEDSVDVYYESVDSTDQGTAYWDGDLLCTCGSVDCSGCTPATQAVCLEPSVAKQSVMYVSPATVENSVLTRSVWSVNREPDRIAANYYAGAYQVDALTGQKVPPNDMARAACYIATANLPAKFCETHEVVKDRFMLYMQDYSFAQEGATGNIRYVTEDISTNPFGTRYGEVLAWRAMKKRIRRGDKKAEVSLIY